MQNRAKTSLLLFLGWLAFTVRADAQPLADAASEPVASTALMEKPDASRCQIPTGWNSIDALKPEFVIFGELHGTRQSPAFVGEVVCALAASGKRILLGIEFDASLDPQFQLAWNLPQSQFAQALSKVGWAGRQDGVASEAMFELLIRLHGLKSAGAAIGIVAFNGAKDDEQGNRFSALTGQNSHEAAQAENIMLAARAADYDLTLVLVGNIHAMKRPVERPQTSFEPMAMRLARSNSVVSLNMKSAGGSAWYCQLKAGFVPQTGKPITDDAITCANNDIKPDPDLEESPSVSISIDPHRLSDDYDGFFFVGKVTGSPPAFPSS